MFDNDNNTSTSGLLGKFRERLRKIKISRAKKKIKAKEDSKDFTEEKIKEKIVNNPKKIEEPRYTEKNKIIRIKVVKKNKYKKITSQKFQDNLTKRNFHIKASPPNESTYKKLSNSPKESNNINSEDKFIETVITRIKETRKDRDYNKRVGISTKKTSPQTKSQSKEISPETQDNKLEELKNRIIYKIKTDFNKKLAELEVLESELYNLTEKNKNEQELEKIKKIKTEINNIIEKINNIIDDYNIYRTNYRLEDVVDLSDKFLVDDIITYKNLVESDYLNKELVNNYKLLEEFQTLYNKLDEIKTISSNLVTENKEKITDLEEKENKHDYTKEEIKIATETLKYCDQEISKQNEYFTELLKKIDIIDKREYTNFKFRGLGNIFSNIATYISTIALSRNLKTVPRIFIRTLATNYLLKNIHKNLQIDKVNKIEYNAKNYDKEILEKINDIDFTYELIDDTLYTIKNIKSDFLLIYNHEIPGFKETLTKLEKIEEKIINNRYQMDEIKKNLNISRNRNNEKIKKLEKLKQST